MKRSLKVIHIAPLDVHLEHYKQIFNSFDNVESIYIVFRERSSAHISDQSLIDTFFFEDSIGLERLVEQVKNGVGLVVINYLIPEFEVLIRSLSDTPIVWNIWGGDLVNFAEQEGISFLGEKSVHIKGLVQLRIFSGPFSWCLRYTLVRYFLGLSKVGLIVNAIVRKKQGARAAMYKRLKSYIPMFRVVCLLDIETSLFEEIFPQHRCDFRQLTMYTMKDAIENCRDEDGRARVEGILVGNSASITNNHLESFELLKQVDSRGSIICPLSYGNKRYGDFIDGLGSHIFGDRFKSIRLRIEKDRYYRTVSSCGYAVFSHKRQEAGTTLAFMLYCGAAVFLDRESLFYKFYRAHSVPVYSTDELREAGNFSMFRRKRLEILMTRTILQNMWSTENSLRQVEVLLKYGVYK